MAVEAKHLLVLYYCFPPHLVNIPLKNGFFVDHP